MRGVGEGVRGFPDMPSCMARLGVIVPLLP